jgi:hypothetical protein
LVKHWRKSLAGGLLRRLRESFACFTFKRFSHPPTTSELGARDAVLRDCSPSHLGVRFAAISASADSQTLILVEDLTMERRLLFSWLAGLPVLALTSARGLQEPKAQKLKIMMKSAWGSDDPTRAAFPFIHGLVLSEAGHDVQIFLTGEATNTMRKATVNAIMPVGWPPLNETLDKVVARHIPIFS